MLYNVLSICLMHCRYLEIMTADDIHDKPWQCIVSNRVTTFLRTLKKFFFFFPPVFLFKMFYWTRVALPCCVSFFCAE